MILSVISTSNCHRLNTDIKMATVHLLPTLHCFCPECIMFDHVFSNYPPLFGKEGGFTDGFISLVIGHPVTPTHSTHV